MGIRNWAFKHSLWLYHVNVGACNNCDIEILELFTPRYDIERFGMLLVGSPRHADALVVTGICTHQTAPRLREIYRQTPKPCLVFIIGACALDRGVFKDGYGSAGTVEDIIKTVDPQAFFAYVPGCPPKPEAMISGIRKAINAV
jgi:membrane-bound hydrogenase subunit mbhJ